MMVNRVKYSLYFVFLIAFVFITIGFASAVPTTNTFCTNGVGNCGVNPPQLWTTNYGCTDVLPNVSVNTTYFDIGQEPLLNSLYFPEGIYNYTITGLSSSCTPGVIFNSSTEVYNGGGFCIAAHVIQPGECGGYNVTFTETGCTEDNCGPIGNQISVIYYVESASVVPEFGIIAGTATVLGALTVFFVIRNK